MIRGSFTEDLNRREIIRLGGNTNIAEFLSKRYYQKN